MSGETFLTRWSRRKLASAAERNPAAETQPAGPAAPPAAVTPPNVPPSGATPLPPVESLTPDSDFAPFLREGVEEQLKRRALKTLFQDPRFNVMDGMDVYIDDFSKPDPLPDGWLEKMSQVARLGDYKEPDERAEPEPTPDPALDAEKVGEEVPVATESGTEPSISPEGTPPSPGINEP